MKASDLFIRCLEEEGVEYLFGVPGEENADFMMSLERSEKIKFILTRHEQGAAFMAEAYGRLTGNPAGCLGTLGPGAIAANLVFPEKRILAICGDAGFLMNVQEMETARRLNSDIVAMVWEDKAYGLIAWKQTNQFGRHTDLSFTNPDWLQLASAFGWNGHYVRNSSDLLPRLERALTEAGPSLLVLPIDYRENRRLSERLGSIVCPI